MRTYLKQRAALFTQRNFLLFALSGLLATLGNGLTYISLVWSIENARESIGSVALLMFCMWGPSIVLAPLIGTLSDRLDQKKLTAFSNLARAICLLLFSLLVATEASFELLLAMGLALGIFNSFYGPASMILIRKIVAPEDLLYANATVDAIYELGSIVGMGAAGVCVYSFGESNALFAGGLLFLVAGLLLLVMQPRQIEANDEHPILSFTSTFQFLSAQRSALQFYAAQSLLMVILYTAPVLLVSYARQILDASVQDFSHLEALFSIGAVLGGILTPYFIERFSRRVILGFQLSILAAAFLFLAFNHHIILAKCDTFLIGFCLSAWAVILTRAQEITPLEMQGKIHSLLNGAVGALVLALYLLLAYFESGIAISALYFAEGAIAFAAFLLVTRFGENYASR